MSDVKKWCAKVITRGWQDTQCNKTGKYEEDGKWWCGLHQPSKEQARREVRDAQDRARREGQTATLEQQFAQRRRADLCVAVCAGVPDEMLLPGAMRKLLDAVAAAGFSVAIVREAKP